MKPKNIILIGASSGGVAALLEVASGLPSGLNAAVGVVLHVGSRASILPELLTSRSQLVARHPADGEALEAGMIYVAPPDQHMLFDADAVRLWRGPRENHTRPAIDPLFRTTALAWGEKTIGVVLTGHLDDGAAGLVAIKDCGGTVIVQDPATAEEPSMPASALESVAADHVLPLKQIAAKLVDLSGGTPLAVSASAEAAERLRQEQAVFEGRKPMENLSALGKVSGLTCPDCGGGLWEIDNGKPLRYRCHTGHAFTARSLENAQLELTDHALWSSVRALQEREMLLRRLAAVAHATGDERQADAGRKQADRVRAQVETLGKRVEGNVNSA